MPLSMTTTIENINFGLKTVKNRCLDDDNWALSNTAIHDNVNRTKLIILKLLKVVIMDNGITHYFHLYSDFQTNLIIFFFKKIISV